MERKDFRQLLIDARTSQELSKNEMCRRMNELYKTIQKIECGDSNAQMSLFYKYISALPAIMVITYQSKNYKVCNEEQLKNLAIALRESSHLSQRKLGSELGVSNLTVRSIENVLKDTSLNTFLSYINYFDCKIEIRIK